MLINDVNNAGWHPSYTSPARTGGAAIRTLAPMRFGPRAHICLKARELRSRRQRRHCKSPSSTSMPKSTLPSQSKAKAAAWIQNGSSIDSKWRQHTDHARSKTCSIYCNEHAPKRNGMRGQEAHPRRSSQPCSPATSASFATSSAGGGPACRPGHESPYLNCVKTVSIINLVVGVRVMYLLGRDIHAYHRK